MEAEEIQKKYHPRILDSQPVRPFIFEYNGISSGYLQKNVIEKTAAAEWGFSEE